MTSSSASIKRLSDNTFRGAVATGSSFSLFFCSSSSCCRTSFFLFCIFFSLIYQSVVRSGGGVQVGVACKYEEEEEEEGEGELPKKLLTILFIQLGDDVFNGVFQPGHYDKFNSIHSTIGGANHFVQNHKCRLHRAIQPFLTQIPVKRLFLSTSPPR